MILVGTGWCGVGLGKTDGGISAPSRPESAKTGDEIFLHGWLFSRQSRRYLAKWGGHAVRGTGQTDLIDQGLSPRALHY